MGPSRPRDRASAAREMPSATARRSRRGALARRHRGPPLGPSGGPSFTRAAGCWHAGCLLASPPRVRRRTMVIRGSNGTFGENSWDGKDLGHTRILLVEDDPKAREILSWLLVMQGAEVLGVASVEEALGVFETFAPDVLVSDLNLTDATGFDLVGELRGRGAEIPAIAISSELGDGVEVL